MNRSPARRARRAGRHLVPLLAALAVSACGGARTRSAEPAIPALPVVEGLAHPIAFSTADASVDSAGTLRLPLDTLLTRWGEPALDRALTALDRACVQARGQTLPPGFRDHAGPNRPPASVYYGAAEISVVRSNGYRTPESAFGWGPQPALSAGASAALYGSRNDASGGCAQAARSRLDPRAGGVRAAFDAVQQLRELTLLETRSDSRVVSATSAWSSCMRRAGLDYPDPLAPQHDRSLLGRGLPVPKGADLPPPSPAEIRAATTDVSCKLRSRYVQTFVLVYAAYQEQAIRQNAARLAALEQAWRTSVAEDLAVAAEPWR